MPLTNSGRLLMLQGDVDLLGDTLKAVLLNNGYAPNKDHEFVSDINTWENSGAGYAAGFGGSGRKTLSGKTLSIDDTNDIVVFDCSDVVWPGLLCGTVAYIAIVRENASDADSDVICVVELEAHRVTNGAEWTWIVDALGVFNW